MQSRVSFSLSPEYSDFHVITFLWVHEGNDFLGVHSLQSDLPTSFNLLGHLRPCSKSLLFLIPYIKGTMEHGEAKQEGTGSGGAHFAKVSHAARASH